MRKAPHGPDSRAGRLTLLAGVLCLNFVNTTSGRGTDHRIEHLLRFEHLLAWARHAGTVEEEVVLEFAAQMPGEQADRRAVRQAIVLRESLHAIFHAVIARRPPPAPALAEFNSILARAMAAAAIEHSPSGYVWRWPVGVTDPERLLWPVVRSAAELLTTGELNRIGFCPGINCGWMFLDTSRNGRRRWCEMEVCGSRAKMRRYHMRHRDRAQIDSAF
jgi:predicted RNA-binding Zn ribbon-like protein